jgi:RHS repeat-associated protein
LLSTTFFHIWGGLRGIDLDATGNLKNSLFSFKLSYEEGTNGYFDGNIRNQYWKSNIDGVQRAYEYSYDKASRIISGAYGSTKAGENYALNGVTYDLNGNITTLSRNGYKSNNTFGLVDNLGYSYQTNSNKIQSVSDNSGETASFTDATGATDYTYSLDGSLTSDANKGISLIEYNYLKLPKRIVQNGVTTLIQYDAMGKKLKETIGTQVTDYVGNKIYKANILYQIAHDEGRIIGGEYEYHIKDHLGNLRVAFRDSSGIAKITQSNAYGCWGENLPTLGYLKSTWSKDFFKFTGKEELQGTGYIDFGARLYDPLVPHFTTIDPLSELSRRFSPFTYAQNNPLRFIDPDGMMATETVGADGLTSSQWVAARGSIGKEDEFKNVNKENKTRNDRISTTITFELNEKDKKTYPKFSQLVQGLRDYVKKNKNVMQALLDYSGLSKKEILKALEYDNGPQINIVELTDLYGYFDRNESMDAINVDKSWVLGYEKAQLNSTKEATGFVLAATLLHEFVHLGRYSKGLSEGIYDYGFGFEKGAFGGNIIEKENAIKLYKKYFQK